MSYPCINGWTKERMKAAIRAGNNGTRALNPGSSYGCLYLTTDGNKCAVGCFIPERHDGQAYFGPCERLLLVYPDLCLKMPLTLVGLQLMQAIHDGHQEDYGDVRHVLCAWIDANVIDQPEVVQP